MSDTKMPFEFLLSTAYAGVEELLNKALSFDQSSKKKLQALEGKLICIESTSPTVKISVTMHEQGILLSPFFEGEVDARISGKASALMNLLIAADKPQALREHKIQIQGDASVIQALQGILSGLNIDWEYQLSKVIGDVPTQFLSDRLNQLQKFSRKSHERLNVNLDEYLHEESALLPGKNELETFYQRIDELSLRLDRSLTRLQKLKLSPETIRS